MLLSLADVNFMHIVLEPQLLKHNGNLAPVRRSPGVKVKHVSSRRIVKCAHFKEAGVVFNVGYTPGYCVGWRPMLTGSETALKRLVAFSATIEVSLRGYLANVGCMKQPTSVPSSTRFLPFV